MTVQHRGLAGGRWQTLSFVEQMSHIGSEVERALNWREKGNPEYSRKALERARTQLRAAKGGPGVSLVQLGPEHREQRVAAVKPAGRRDREVGEQAQPLGLVQDRGDLPAILGEIQPSERAKFDP